MPAMTTAERNARAKEKRAAISHAHKERAAHIHAAAGNDLMQGAKRMLKKAEFTDWSSFLRLLRNGVTVTTSCQQPPENGQRYGKWVKHTVRLNSDGSVNLPSHPNLGTIDVETELFMLALGGHLSNCVATAIHLPPGHHAPGVVSGQHDINTSMRVIHTAVAWAQVPDHQWSPQFGDSHLRYGITPAVQAAWDADGWNRARALVFQQQFASLEIANLWRAEGQLTQRAARLAGLGEHPDEEQRWAQAGFTAAASAKWRKTTLSPEEAYEWERHNITPSMVERLVRLERAGGVPVAIAKQWCAAGIPSSEVASWYRVSSGDLEAALMWHRAKIKPAYYDIYMEWNRTHPAARQLDPSVVREYRRAHIAGNSPDLIDQARQKGVTPQTYKAAVETLKQSDSALLAALLATTPPEDARLWWPQPDENPERTYRRVRNGWPLELLTFIIDWIARNHH